MKVLLHLDGLVSKSISQKLILSLSTLQSDFKLYLTTVLSVAKIPAKLDTPGKMSFDELQTTLTKLKVDMKDFGNDLVAPLFPCYKNGEWEMRLYGGDQLINVKIIQPTEGLYFAKERQDELDGYMSFFDWFCKCVNYKDMNSFIQAIYEDLLLLNWNI